MLKHRHVLTLVLIPFNLMKYRMGVNRGGGVLKIQTSILISPHFPSVPGSRAPQTSGREEGTRARGHSESHRGEQQLHQNGQREVDAENGGQQGEQGGPSSRYDRTSPGEG